MEKRDYFGFVMVSIWAAILVGFGQKLALVYEETELLLMVFVVIWAKRDEVVSRATTIRFLNDGE